MLEDKLAKHISYRRCQGDISYLRGKETLCSYALSREVTCEYSPDGKHCDNMFELPARVEVRYYEFK